MTEALAHESSKDVPCMARVLTTFSAAWGDVHVGLTLSGRHLYSVCFW